MTSVEISSCFKQLASLRGIGVGRGGGVGVVVVVVVVVVVDVYVVVVVEGGGLHVAMSFMTSIYIILILFLAAGQFKVVVVFFCGHTHYDLNPHNIMIPLLSAFQ